MSSTTTKPSYGVAQGTIGGFNFNPSVSSSNQVGQSNVPGVTTSTGFLGGSSLFGTGVKFDDPITPQAKQKTGNLFTDLLSGLGFGGGLVTDDQPLSGDQIFTVTVDPNKVKGETERTITIS